MNSNPFESIEAKLDALASDVRTLKSRTNDKPPNDEIGDINLYCEVTKNSKSTGYKAVHYRTVPHFKKGGRLFFRRSELEKWLDEGRRPTASEIEEERMEGNKRAGKH